MPEPEEPTALYRLYDAEYDLLYIGISMTPEKRFKAHAHDKNWWHLVTYVDLTWHPTFALARRAEDDAHMTERPPFNAMGRTPLGEIPALRYDDSAEQATVRALLLAGIASGTHRPGSRIWPFRVSQETGYSRTTVHAAVDSLARQGLLKFAGRSFEVLTPAASHGATPSAPKASSRLARHAGPESR
jgi:hypothetical protein